MKERGAEILTDVFRVQTDRLLTVLLCLVALFVVFGYSRVIAAKPGKWLWWGGSFGALLALGLTLGNALGRSPQGLSGSYYDNPTWSGEPVNSLRYFETPGRRIDRFIDFNPNDFNDRYPFSGQPFSVEWQGYVNLPRDGYQLGVNSNFGVWLTVDGTLVAGSHQLDFGTAAARTFLREGWSQDERWGTDANLSFVWSSGPRAEFYLGVDELTDYLLSVRCMPFVYEGSPGQELTIAINGVTLAAPIRLKEGWQTYTILVPRTVLQGRVPGFFRVRFTYAKVIRPAEINHRSQDSRELAAAVDFVRMQKATAGAEGTAAFPPKSFSAGLHRITLQALQNKWGNPFIQLTWQRNQTRAGAVISEDALFPASATTANIQARALWERGLLRTSIVLKGCLLLLGAGLAGRVYLPRCLKWIGRREALGLLGILGLAFVVRVVFLLEMKQRDPTFDILPGGTDPLGYVFFARGFWRGYWPGLAHEPFYFCPLISFYNLVWALLVGESLTALRLANAVMATGSVGLTFGLARRVFNLPVAYLAAGLCAGNGVLIFADTSLLLEPLLTFLSLLALWLCVRLKDTGALRNLAAAGVVLGLAALARPNTLLLLPLLFFWLYLASVGTLRLKVGRYLVICLLLAATILPVTLWNYLSTDKHPFVLINSSGGINLWIGNNPSANGEYSFSSDLLEDARQRMRAAGTSYLAEVWRYIQAHPGDYVRLEVKKIKMFWRGYETGNLFPYYFVREHFSDILKLPWLNFVVIGPLGLAGMFLAIRTWRNSFLLYGFVAVQLLNALLFLALARYRLPLVPVLSIFAAYTLWEGMQTLRQKRRRRLGMLIGLVVILYLALNYPYAAELYQQRYQVPMPLTRVLRYWDVFHFDAS